MLFSELLKIMVKKVTLVGFGGGAIAPIDPPTPRIRPCLPCGEFSAIFALSAALFFYFRPFMTVYSKHSLHYS